ncbi:conserved hypothetical protein [Vibrio chagasii]|nr:conserved hypothetical protein [Vibrio chagasii]
MGNYTRLRLNVGLKSDTPEEFLKSLTKKWAGDVDLIVKERRSELPSHPLFDRARSLFLIGECNTESGVLKLSPNSAHIELEFNKSIKNYEGELQLFLDWIAPYIALQFNECLMENYNELFGLEQRHIRFSNGSVEVSGVIRTQENGCGYSHGDN